MTDAITEELVSMVSSLFKIKGVYQSPSMLQIEIEDDDFKEKFVQLAQKTELKNLVARLEKKDDRIFILISRFIQPKLRRAWIPRALFAATIIMVVIDGYYRTTAANSISYIGNSFNIAVLYTISLMGILGIHELGHIIASRWHKIKTSWPYFIPGIPIIAFPTFGALIMARSFMTNRDTLFDVGISGPIAGLIIAVIVSIFGAHLSPLVPLTQAPDLFAHSELIKIHSSIIMDATILLAGKHAVGQELIMSPVLFAAWIGFLITFLNLLPAWQLDGGHIARATFGRKWHKITTYASIGVLISLGYWFMALFVLSFSMQSPDAKPLDDISPLSSKRKKMFVFIMILAFLCAPLPFSILK